MWVSVLWACGAGEDVCFQQSEAFCSAQASACSTNCPISNYLAENERN